MIFHKLILIFSWYLIAIYRCENALPYTSQAYGLFPVWKRLCSVRLSICENALSHTSQVYGLFPVWQRLCLLR